MAFSDTNSWFADGTTGFYPAPDSTTGNLYISNSPNTIGGAGTWVDTTTGAYSNWTTTATAEMVNKKVVVKCSKCGAKIAEYWAKITAYQHAQLDVESDILCETCHKIEKLKE